MAVKRRAYPWYNTKSHSIHFKKWKENRKRRKKEFVLLCRFHHRRKRFSLLSESNLTRLNYFFIGKLLALFSNLVSLSSSPLFSLLHSPKSCSRYMTMAMAAGDWLWLWLTDWPVSNFISVSYNIIMITIITKVLLEP